MQAEDGIRYCHVTGVQTCARPISPSSSLNSRIALPTRGLDVGAIESVHRRRLAERDAGKAILLFSLELEEVRSLADRILVIYDGRIVGELPPTASDEELGLMMTGSSARTPS